MCNRHTYGQGVEMNNMNPNNFDNQFEPKEHVPEKGSLYCIECETYYTDPECPFCYMYNLYWDTLTQEQRGFWDLINTTPSRKPGTMLDERLRALKSQNEPHKN